jgi:hypothetical protein
MTTDLWVEATRDVDAEQHAYGLEMAKSAGMGAWTFLALARSKQEFADRVGLASDSIVRAAGAGGVSPEDLLKVFTERFALLMEAGENPFADQDDTGDGDDEDDDKDSKDEKDDDAHGDGKSDSSGDDDAKDDDEDKSNSNVNDAGSGDSDENGGDGNEDDGDSDDDHDDDNADDSDKGKDEDPDQKDDMDGREASPAFGGMYSSLLQRIERGEDPLMWGGRPFVASLGRTAVGADAGPVSDTNVPTPTADPGGGSLGLPGMGGSEPLTTKPRQAPGGDQGLSTPPADPGVDPAMNGGDIQAQQPAESNPFTSKLMVIAADVHRSNPQLSQARCVEVANTVMARFLVQAEDVSPLLFGDRGTAADGPLSGPAKKWSPPDVDPSRIPGRGSGGSGDGGSDDTDSDGDAGGAGGSGAGSGGAGGAGGAGEAAAGAGEAAGAAGEIGELAPLLLL